MSQRNAKSSKQQRRLYLEGMVLNADRNKKSANWLVIYASDRKQYPPHSYRGQGSCAELSSALDRLDKLDTELL